jgi:hypothetical protein
MPPARNEIMGAALGKRILVPIDGFEDAALLVARLGDLRSRQPIEVHLLNVQPRFPGHVAMFFSAAEIRRFHHEDAMRELAAARDLLARAAIPFTCHIEIGNFADIVAALAAELRCRHILMHEAAKGVLSGMVLGVLASQVKGLVAGSNTLCEVI